jgi:competence protein ComEA
VPSGDAQGRRPAVEQTGGAGSPHEARGRGRAAPLVAAAALALVLWSAAAARAARSGCVAEDDVALGATRVDLNSAPEEELEALPGVGPVLARRIVEAREEGGPFASAGELLLVEGITETLVERLRPLVAADGPDAGGREAGSR